jgi:outer membrane protein assembly factor BamB
MTGSWPGDHPPGPQQYPGPPQYPGPHQYPGPQQHPGPYQYPGPQQHPGPYQSPGAQQYPGPHQYPAPPQPPGAPQFRVARHRTQGPGPGGRPPRRRWPLWYWIVPGAVVIGVIVLLVALTVPGGGTRRPAGASGPASAPPAGWEATQPQYDATGTVAFGSELVVTADTGVYAYDRATGRALWHLEPPTAGGAPGAFCGSAQNAAGGLLSVGIGRLADPQTNDISCTSVGLVNLKSGRLAWIQPVPTPALAKANQFATGGIQTAIVGTTVMATWNDVAAGFSAGGQRLWTQQYDGEINDLAVARGQFYAVFAIPEPFADEPPVAVDGISPASGDITSRLHITAQLAHIGVPELGAIVATSPMTVLVSDGSSADNASYLVLDPTDQHITQVIPAGAQVPGPGQHILNAGYTGGNTDSHPYVKAIVAGRLLITITASDGPAPVRLAAYDLSTGARAWTADPPGLTMVAPVAVDGPAVVAVGLSRSSHNPVLIRVSPASGKVLSAAPRPTGRDQISDLLDNYYFAWADSRVYAVDWEQAPGVGDVPGLFTIPAAP